MIYIYIYSERVTRMHHAFLTSNTAFFFLSVADLCLKRCLCLFRGAVIYSYKIIIAASLKLLILRNAVTSPETVLNGNSVKTKLYKTPSPILYCIR